MSSFFINIEDKKVSKDDPCGKFECIEDNGFNKDFINYIHSSKKNDIVNDIYDLSLENDLVLEDTDSGKLYSIGVNQDHSELMLVSEENKFDRIIKIKPFTKSNYIIIDVEHTSLVTDPCMGVLDTVRKIKTYVFKSYKCLSYML